MTEALLLILAVTLITAVVFNQSNPLLLCLPMLPTMFATIRLGRFGAASSIVIMTVIGGGMTMLGHGPIHSTADDAVSRAQFLQLYLATAVLLVLPVAALLRQHRDLVTRVSESEARYRLIERHSTDAVLNAGIDGDIHYASSAFSTLGGFDPEAMIGRNALELVQECDRPAVARAHHEALRTPDRAVSVEYRVMVASGEMRWFESNTRAVIAETGLPIGVVSAIRDVSHRKAAEHKLRQAADTDALTGLPNRRAFIDLLATGWQRVRGGEGECAVAIFDIDSFKAVNDVHGHAVGDLALNAFANVARRTLRGADVIARIGGEEFAVLFWNAELVTAAAAAERLRCAVAKEVIQTGAGARFSMTVSVGLAALSAAVTPAEALEAADEALYAAKHAGRNCLRLVC